MYDGLAVRRAKASFIRERRTASPSYEFHHSLGAKADNLLRSETVILYGETRRTWAVAVKSECGREFNLCALRFSAVQDVRVQRREAVSAESLWRFSVSEDATTGRFSQKYMASMCESFRR